MQGHPLVLPVKKNCSVDILDISFWISGGIPKYPKTDQKLTKARKLSKGLVFRGNLNLIWIMVNLDSTLATWALHIRL
jgi:hypothetical protein